MMMVTEELDFYKRAVIESLMYNIAEGFSTDSCMIAQIGSGPQPRRSFVSIWSLSTDMSL